MTRIRTIAVLLAAGLLLRADAARAGGCSLPPGVLTQSLEECSFSCAGTTFHGTANLSGVDASIVMFCSGTVGSAGCSLAEPSSSVALSCGDIGTFQVVNGSPPVDCTCEVNRGLLPAALIIGAGCSCN